MNLEVHQVSGNLCQSIYKIEKDSFEVSEEDECVCKHTAARSFGGMSPSLLCDYYWGHFFGVAIAYLEQDKSAQARASIASLYHFSSPCIP